MDALPLDVKHRVLLQLVDLSSGRSTTQQVVRALGSIEQTCKSWREAVQMVGGAVTACSSAPAAAAELRWLHAHPALRILHLWIDHSSIASTLHQLHAAAPQAWQARLSAALVSASYSLLRLPRSALRFGRVEFSPPTSEEDTPAPEALPLGLLLRAPSVTLDLEKCAAKVLLLDAPEAAAGPLDWQAALLGALEAADADELVVVGAAGAALARVAAGGGAPGSSCPLAAAGFEALDLRPWQLHAGRRDPQSGFAALRPAAARLPAGLLEFCEAPGGAEEARALFDACRRRSGLAHERRWHLWCWKEGVYLEGEHYRLPRDWATTTPFPLLYRVLHDPPTVHWWELEDAAPGGDPAPFDPAHRPGHQLLLEHWTQRALGLKVTVRAGAALDLRECCHDVKSPFLDLTLHCPAAEAGLQLRPRLKELRLTAGCPEAAALPGAGLPWLDWAAPPARRLVLTDFGALDLGRLPAGGRGSTVVVRSFDPGWRAAIALPAARPGPGPHHLSVFDYGSREGSTARISLAPCLPTLGHLEVRGERRLCLEVPHPTLRHWGEELAALRPPDERSLLVHALCEEGPVFRFATGQRMACREVECGLRKQLKHCHGIRVEPIWQVVGDRANVGLALTWLGSSVSC